MRFVSAAGLDKDETLGTFRLLFAHRFTLPVLDREGVGIPIHIFERGKDFAHILFDDFVERDNLVEARERQHNGVRRRRHHWGKNRNASYNSKGAFGTDEYLLQVVS